MVRGFDIAHVLSTALAAGIPLLAVLNDKGDSESLGIVGLCALAAAAGAAIAGIVCRWWPGLGAAGWRLWLAAWLFNPVVILALGYVLSQYECLLGQVRGWGCMGFALVVLASPATLVGPTIAVITHVIVRNLNPQPTQGPAAG